MSATWELVARLAHRSARRSTGRRIARSIGADHLMIFVRDPEIDVLLPAIGFPQTLPRGREWPELLAAVRASGHAELMLASPFTGEWVPAIGRGITGGAVVVALGGATDRERMEELAAVMPVATSTFALERREAWLAQRAEREGDAAEQARRLAISLVAARREVELGAQQAIRAREEFLAIASHELRTPIAAIKLSLQSIERTLRSPSPSPSVLSGRLASALREVDRLDRLSNKLLDVARITTGRMKLERENVDLLDVVRDAAARMVEDAARAGSELTVVRAHRAVGRWDRLRLSQVLVNLLSNAIAYGAGRPIELSVEHLGQHVRLGVRDHGEGIPAELLPAIFHGLDHPGPRGRKGGLGLGLLICRQIIEAHDGTIWAESPPGEGAVFWVELPLDAPSADESGAPG